MAAAGPVRLRAGLAARLRPASAARITGGLWAGQRTAVAEAGLSGGLDRAGHSGELCQWLEAVGWLSAEDRMSEALRARVDTAVGRLRAEPPDGIGHLIQAAIAHDRATGRTDLLTDARTRADQLCERTGPAGDQRIETALVELYRHTGATKYLDRARTLLGGAEPASLSALAGMADVYLETGEPELLAAAERQWAELVRTRTHLTGEITGDSLVASVLLSWRLLLATGKSRYADLIERTLHNAFLAGLSADGPPEVMRLLTSIQHYVASSIEDGLVLHPYLTGGYAVDTAHGPVSVLVRTDYPWHGSIRIQIGQSIDQDWTLALRIPAWAQGYRVYIDDAPVSLHVLDGWLRLCRRWWIGDTLRLELDLKPRLTEANPRVDAARGCLAIERGPLVYRLAAAEPDADLDDVLLDSAAEMSTVERDGQVLVTASGRERADTHPDSWWPYRTPPERVPLGRTVELTAVPYCARGNGEFGETRVWLPRT